jgi:hypothetical protein
MRFDRSKRMSVPRRSAWNRLSEALGPNGSVGVKILPTVSIIAAAESVAPFFWSISPLSAPRRRLDAGRLHRVRVDVAGRRYNPAVPIE